MSEQENPQRDDAYDVEEGEEAAGAPSSAASPAQRSTCPECGAAMEAGQAKCIRCAPTATPQKTAGPSMPRPAPVPGDSRALVQSGRGDLWLPTVVGAIALLVLIIGHIAGWQGLYAGQQVNGETIIPGLGARLTELLRNGVLLLFWASCGLAGLFATSIILERQFGDARLAAVRIAAVLVTIRLITLLPLAGPEWVGIAAEIVLQVGAFIGLSMLFFALMWRNALILTISTLMGILLLWLFTYAVQWALTI